MDTVFSLSSEGVYKVSAKVGQYSLDDCAVIPSGVPIHPYFLNPVDGDPDIQKLTVFLQTSYGEILSKKVTYIIDPDMEISTADGGSNPSDETYKPDSGSSSASGSTSGSASSASGFTPDSGSSSASGLTPDSGSSSASGLTSGSASSSASGFTPDSASSSDSGLTSGSASSSASGFTPDSPSSSASGLTSDPGSSSASTVTTNSGFTDEFGFTTEFNFPSGPGFTPDSSFDAAYDDIYAWEASVEESEEEAYRFLKWGSIIQPSVSFNEDIIYVKKLSGVLPSLLLPEDIEAGQYILVFQVIGEKGALNQTEKPFYYIGESEFTLDDIQVYLPGIFDKGHLVSPEIPVMLETKLAAGTNLNPYVVWYNGKKRIHEGYVADGAARFIWRTPDQTGFHVLKVEAFPFKPLNATGTQPPIGRVKELSLPVAPKKESPVVDSFSVMQGVGFSGQELIPVRHYQLFAELEDSQNFASVRTALTAVNHIPEWLPRGNIFGVAVGPANRFSIPGPLFTPSEETEGQLLFRFVPLANGIIFSGSFKLKVRFEQNDNFDPFETVDMNLSYTDGTVSLRYFAGSVSGEKNIFLFPGQTDGVITVVISFEVQQNTLRLSLGLDTPVKFLADEGIPLSGPLTGDGTFLLGASFEDAGTGADTTVFSVQTMSVAEWGSDATQASVMETNPVSPVVVLDEIAVLIIPDISLNTAQTIEAVSPSPAGSTEEGGILPEDIASEEAMLTEDDDVSGFEEIAGEPEITVLSATKNRRYHQ